MKAKYAVWVAFFLNLTYAIVEFIAGGVFGSSAVLADSVHDLGDAIAIGISAFLETISNREEDNLSFLSLFFQKPFHVFGLHSRFSWMLCQKVLISSK